MSDYPHLNPPVEQCAEIPAIEVDFSRKETADNPTPLNLLVWARDGADIDGLVISKCCRAPIGSGNLAFDVCSKCQRRCKAIYISTCND